MRYMGGKLRIRKKLSKVIESYRSPGQSYFEPFVGGGWVLQEIYGKRYASDANEHLISLYLSLQNGWIPPDFVSEEQYKFYKINQPKNDPLTAFIGFGCSFSGKWFGGHAKDSDKYFPARETKNSLKRQLPLIKDVEFKAVSYEDCNPNNFLIYCDPPYEGTTAYNGVEKFDSEKFWDIMRVWSQNNTVLISEYRAPGDFKCVSEFNSRMGLRTIGKTQELRVERLFKYDAIA